MTSQWLGIAHGLLAIHSCPHDEESELSDGQVNDGLGSQRVDGSHGDIKPENILWFPVNNAEDQQIPANGKLVLANFGLTELYRFETGVLSPQGIAIPPTYRAPEFDVSAGLSQSYDIWTLGCVLLEFIVWYLQGFDAFEQFSIDRCTEDNGIIQEDKYFAIKPNVKNNSGQILSAAILKSSVHRVSWLDSSSLAPEPYLTDIDDDYDSKLTCCAITRMSLSVSWTFWISSSDVCSKCIQRKEQTAARS